MPIHSLLRVAAPLAANAPARPLDVLRIKSALAALGHYAAPDWGVTPYPDRDLFDAVKAFQRERGLTVDGRMKPEGETETALAEVLTPQTGSRALTAMAEAVRALGRGGDTVLAHITPEEAALLDAVTDGVSVNPATGLPEFWHDYEADAYGVGDSSQNSGPDRSDRNNDANDRRKDGGGRQLTAQAASPQSQGDMIKSTGASKTSVHGEDESQARRARQASLLGSGTSAFAGGLLNSAEDEEQTAETLGKGTRKTRTFTPEQLDAAKRANAVKALDRLRVKEYARRMNNPHVRPDSVSPSQARETEWNAAVQKFGRGTNVEAELQRMRQDEQEATKRKALQTFREIDQRVIEETNAIRNVTKSIAARLGVDLTDRAVFDPAVQDVLARSLSYGQLDPRDQGILQGDAWQLSKTYPEFGMSGLFGNMAVSISDPEKEPWSMTGEELRAARARNLAMIDALEVIGIAGGEGGQFVGAAKRYYEQAIKRIEREQIQRSGL